MAKTIIELNLTKLEESFPITNPVEIAENCWVDKWEITEDRGGYPFAQDILLRRINSDGKTEIATFCTADIMLKPLLDRGKWIIMNAFMNPYAEAPPESGRKTIFIEESIT